MRIRYTRRAIEHLESLKTFSTRRFGSATTATTLATIEAAINALADLPGQGRPGRIAGTRERVIPGFPFIVAYRVTPTTIDILAILHAAQRWPRSLPS